MKAKPGLEFLHRRVLASDYSGCLQAFRVTKVAQGLVYYRPLYGKHDDGSDWLGSPAYIAAEKFATIAKPIL